MSNIIKDIDDVDDDLFVSKKPQNYIFAEKKASDISQRTNDILSNTRRLVQESEQVGQSTLENLGSQREALERVENDLDNINTMTRATQKHLNHMRSFWGGLKSLFGNNSVNAGQTTIQNTKNPIPRSQTIADMPSNNPGRSRNEPREEIRSSFAAPSGNTLQASTKSPDGEFEANLSEIGFGLGKLREMALKMGDEIGDQNDMLDRITGKSERAADSVKHQNRQINQLLK